MSERCQTCEGAEYILCADAECYKEHFLAGRLFAPIGRAHNCSGCLEKRAERWMYDSDQCLAGHDLLREALSELAQARERIKVLLSEVRNESR